MRSIGIDSLIPASLLADPEAVCQKLAQHPELLVLDQNAPKFFVVSLDAMERFQRQPERAVEPLAGSAKTAAAPPSVLPFSAVPPAAAPPVAVPHTGGGGDNSEKIGELVRWTFKLFSQRQILPREEVQNLCGKRYSTDTFGVSYPVLKRIDPNLPPARLDDERKVEAYYRYYKAPLSFCGGEYLLCNHWFAKSESRFHAWAARWTPRNGETP